MTEEFLIKKRFHMMLPLNVLKLVAIGL
jgi:hypothetical protein